MRRLFSTFYRILLTAASISAVVLSILAATSCDFLDFVHPYEAGGRSLSVLRYLQESDVAGGDTDALPESVVTTTPTTVGLVNTDYLAQLADSISQAGNLTDGTDVGADDASSQAAGVIAAAVNSTVEEVATPPGDVGASGASDESAAAGDSGSSEGSGAPTGSENVPAGDDEEASANKATASEETVIAAQPGDSGTGTESDANTTDALTQAAPGIGDIDEDTGMSNKTDIITDDFVANIPANAYGKNTSDIPSVAVSGSAGLFCSANDVSIFNIWKGTFLDSELAIDEESEHDESEDIARNGAVVSITFGVLVAFILVVETIFGWKMCCEKWIVGFLSLFACVSQGVTFLFFNSERYCNANIIHEILEQDPCVPGSGGQYSIIALVLYALIILFICCAPSADPYHLLCCCRAQKEANASDPNFSSLELADNKSSDGTSVGTGKEEESNVALSGRDHTAAPWMSEEQREKDENEII